MAKIELKHLDFYRDTDFLKVEVYKAPAETIIHITGMDVDSGEVNMYFDKSTAIRFAKTLRTEINKIQ